MKEELFLVIAYDVESDKRRNRLVKLLKDHGVRVNFSVFECRIRKSAYESIKKEISLIINKKIDSVLFYDLCLNCLEKAEYLGAKIPSHADPIVAV